MFRKKRIKMLEKELKEKEFEIQELEKMLDVDNLDMDRLHKENKQKDDQINDLKFKVQEYEGLLNANKLERDRLIKDIELKDEKILELKEDYHFLKEDKISSDNFFKDSLEKIKSGEWKILTKETQKKLDEKYEAYARLQRLVRSFEDSTGICTDGDSDHYYDLYDEGLREEATAKSWGFYTDVISLAAIEASIESYRDYMDNQYELLEP